MPRYEFSCCNKNWTEYAEFDNRDRVLCDVCNAPARRLLASFNFVGASYVGTDRFKGAELGTGIKGLESTKDVDRALKETGAQPVDAYYRPPAPPPPKEITLKEIAPYLDGMPL